LNSIPAPTTARWVFKVVRQRLLARKVPPPSGERALTPHDKGSLGLKKKLSVRGVLATATGRKARRASAYPKKLSAPGEGSDLKLEQVVVFQSGVP